MTKRKPGPSSLWSGFPRKVVQPITARKTDQLVTRMLEDRLTENGRRLSDYPVEFIAFFRKKFTIDVLMSNAELYADLQFAHYGVPRGKNEWKKLALSYAVHFNPAFQQQSEGRRGRPPWDEDFITLNNRATSLALEMLAQSHPDQSGLIEEADIPRKLMNDCRLHVLHERAILRPNLRKMSLATFVKRYREQVKGVAAALVVNRAINSTPSSPHLSQKRRRAARS